MEDKRRALERPLQRALETNRLEDQLWTLAYERVWPVLRRRCQRASVLQPRRRASATAQPIARRA
jgi:hypothetical protein